MEGYTLFIPQCFISARLRHQSLLQNCGDTECVWECVWDREFVCAWEQWWRYVVSLRARFGFCLESGLMFSLLSKYLLCPPALAITLFNSESSIAALPWLCSLFLTKKVNKVFLDWFPFVEHILLLYLQISSKVSSDSVFPLTLFWHTLHFL